MFGIFTLAIRFDCLFSGIFSKFSLICDFNFWQLAPPLNICFKWCFKSLFSQFQRKKNSLKRAKNVIFSLFCILVDRSMGGEAIAPASPMATLLLVLRHIMVNPALINALRSKKAKCGPEIATFRTKTSRFLRVIRLKWLAKIELRGTGTPGLQ